jgi:hypothetical protein
LKRIQRVTLISLVLFAVAVFQAGCGNYNGSGSTVPVSKLKKRVFVSNSASSQSGIQIVDASKDQFTGLAVTGGAGFQPSVLLPSANNTTVVLFSGDNSVGVIDNTKEALGGAANAVLAGSVQDLAVSADGKKAYAAIPTVGQISVIDLTPTTALSVTANIPVPAVRRLALSHNGAKLLAFSDNLDTVALINTADSSITMVAGFDRPTSAVFSSDDTKAYILSCGAECGGTQARVTVLNIGNSTLGTSVNVPAATVGLLDGGSLYVVGSLSPTSGQAQPLGRFTVLDANALTVTKTINVGDGFHRLMSEPSTGKVLVGARTCTTGCLSIVDVAGGNVAVSKPTGDVTGIAPVNGRTVAYVTEGGELIIYDLSTNLPQANQLDVVGDAAGVLYVGPD